MANYFHVRFCVHRVLLQFESKFHLNFTNNGFIQKHPKKNCKPYLLFASCLSTSSDKTLAISNTDVKNEIQTYIEQNKEKLRFTEQKILLKRDVILEDIRQRKNRMKEDLKQRKDKMKEDIRFKTGKMREKVEEIIERENIYTIPNLLCITRIGLSPYLGMLIVQADFQYALGVLGIAALTDLLDGWIARTWTGQSSKMGSFLDPMADKVLIGTLFLSLTYADLIPIALTGLIVTRDVLLVTAGIIIRYRSLPPPRTISRYFDATHATAQLSPTFVGKVNTAVQLLLVGSTMAAPVFHYVDHPLLQSLWYITGATTVAAGLSYVLSKNTYKFLGKK